MTTGMSMRIELPIEHVGGHRQVVLAVGGIDELALPHASGALYASEFAPCSVRSEFLGWPSP